MNDEEFINLMVDAQMYSNIQCAEHHCSSCPASNSYADRKCDCQLYFMQEYFKNNKYYIAKED